MTWKFTGLNPQAYRVQSGAPHPPENRDHLTIIPFRVKEDEKYYHVLMRVDEHQQPMISALLKYLNNEIDVLVIVFPPSMSDQSSWGRVTGQHARWLLMWWEIESRYIHIPLFCRDVRLPRLMEKVDRRNWHYLHQGTPRGNESMHSERTGFSHFRPCKALLREVLFKKLNPALHL